MSRHRQIRNDQQSYVDDYYESYSEEEEYGEDSYDSDYAKYISGGKEQQAYDPEYDALLSSALDAVYDVIGYKMYSEKEIIKVLEQYELDTEFAIDKLMKMNEEKNKEKKKQEQQEKKKKEQAARQQQQNAQKFQKQKSVPGNINKAALAVDTPKMSKSNSIERISKITNEPDGLRLDLNGMDLNAERNLPVLRSQSPNPKGLKKKKKINVLEEYTKRREKEKETLHLIVIGHVDAGKSTLMGHLLVALGAVDQSIIHRYERESQKIGKSSFAFAWVLDETTEERSRGVTMDIAVREFETPKKKITILDAPGHRDFIPNMIMGATQADVAMLVANATTNEFEAGFELGGQTREHAILARSLGVTQLIVAVNKMDTVDYNESRYKEIVEKLKIFLKKTGFKDTNVIFVPCSGYMGENLVKNNSDILKKWYTGPSVVEAIDLLKTPSRPIDKPLRICISDIFKSNTGSMLAGNVISGSVSIGDDVMLMPGSEPGTIKSIIARDEDTDWAVAGDMIQLSAVGIDNDHYRIGSFLSSIETPMVTATKFRAQLVIFKIDMPIIRGYSIVLHFQKVEESGNITKLLRTIDRNSGEVLKKNPRALTKDSAAIVEISLNRSLCLDSTMRNLSRFTLRNKGVTVAAGMLEEVLE